MPSDEDVQRAQDLVCREGLKHLASACLNIERVKATLPSKRGQGFTIVSDAENAVQLQSLAVHLGQASLTLFDGSKSRPKEPPLAAKLRRQRVAKIAEFVSGIDIEPLNDREVRNRLIHVDEYMIMAALRDESWLIDISLSHREIFNAPGGMNYCRVYVFSEDKLLHLGAELDVGAAYDAGMAVLERFGWKLNREPDIPSSN